VGWLRAAVLGANDGIISTACLIIGVAAASATHHDILIAGVAALVAGAMSMAAGEYVSVSSQLDSENADLERERHELETNRPAELNELTAIYIKRGLDQHLARQVAEQLMEHDALGAHARDEIGISELMTARPIQAALSSASSFAIGAALPLFVTTITPGSNNTIALIAGSAMAALVLLGGLAAKVGGAPVMRGIVRVTFWGALAMGVSAGIGHLFGTIV
jgi:VIT1/CCC1 family predicted Fe2+/Mn2+ transporter